MHDQAEFASDELDVAFIQELERLARKNDFEGYLTALNKGLAEVKTEDSGEPLIALNRSSLGDRVYLWLVTLGVDAIESDRMQLRGTVVAKLKAAAASLPHNYSLIVRDAFRTEKMVWDLYRLYMARLKDREPTLTEKERDLRIRNTLAMPDDPAPPGHMTGGAVDIVLGDKNGNRVHLEVDEDQIPRKDQAATLSPGLPPEIVERRQILFAAMTNQGFHNYSREYWHFSYGDAYWAVRRRIKKAVYGIPRAVSPHRQDEAC